MKLGFICKYPYSEPKTELSFTSYGLWEIFTPDRENFREIFHKTEKSQISPWFKPEDKLPNFRFIVGSMFIIAAIQAAACSTWFVNLLEVCPTF
jgi:hypothetical protein